MMINYSAVEDISLLINYYDANRKPKEKLEIGQIVFTPVTFIEKRHKLYDVTRSNPTAHQSVNFEFRVLDDNLDFRKKPGRLPIAALKLGETEELLAVKAKMRPCLVVAKIDGLDFTTLPEGVQRNKALNSFNSIYLLAPIYSISNGSKATVFGPVLTARIKCMMYPEFIYAPQNPPLFDTPKIIRLDRMFWSHLIACTEPKPIYLSKEMMGICWSQIKIISGEQSSKDYAELRDLLLADLPEDCK